MKVGDYVRINKNIRTISIGIGKIINIVQNTIYVNMNNNLPISFEKSEISKSSPNIIDLIEVGDYVNGLYVINKPFNQRIHTEFDDFFEEDIKSIVTKEQFSSMEYKVGE